MKFIPRYASPKSRHSGRTEKKPISVRGECFREAKMYRTIQTSNSSNSNDYAVLYIITKLELGGAQKVCLSLFKQNEHNGIPSYLATGPTGILANEVRNNPNVFFISAFEREISCKKIVREFVCFFQLVRLIRKLKRQHQNLIVHTHSTKAGIIGRWAAFFALCKRIHTIHGFAFHSFQSRFVWTALYFIELITSLITDHYICVSSADIATGTKLFPFFATKHSLIRAAIDEHFFVPATVIKKPKKNNFIFGSIACFKPQKNIVDTLRAFAWVNDRNPQVKLELIGDGTLRVEIEQWIADHQLEKIIALHGWQAEVKKYLITWDAFVLSSLWEGLPCAIIEAQRCGLPVVAYNAGGIHEVISHNHNGLLYQPSNWQELARGMLEICSDQKLFEKLANNAGTFQEFHEKSMHKQHMKLYSRIMR